MWIDSLYFLSTGLGFAVLFWISLFFAWEILVRLVWKARARAASRRLRSSLFLCSPLLSLVRHEREMFYARARERTSWNKLTQMKPIRHVDDPVRVPGQEYL